MCDNMIPNYYSYWTLVCQK